MDSGLWSTPHKNCQLQNLSLPIVKRYDWGGHFLWGVDFDKNSFPGVNYVRASHRTAFQILASQEDLPKSGQELFQSPARSFARVEGGLYRGGARLGEDLRLCPLRVPANHTPLTIFCFFFITLGPRVE